MERILLTSHDDVLSRIAQLKTPLTAIRSFSEILRDNPDLPDDERQRFLSIVLDETERLHQHIERMLEG
jgi:signal transduction histidine kinase